MRRIAVEVTPKEYARIEALARAWMKRTGRRVGRGPVAPFVRQILLDVLMEDMDDRRRLPPRWKGDAK